ncbi:MAG: hypothetical protein AAF420_11175, partial [Pseudomonadota bacterium]
MKASVNPRLWAIFATICITFTALGAHADNGEQKVNHYEGVAMDGFDVVAYFLQGKPVKGDAAFALKHKGVTWHF